MESVCFKFSSAEDDRESHHAVQPFINLPRKAWNVGSDMLSRNYREVIDADEAQASSAFIFQCLDFADKRRLFVVEFEDVLGNGDSAIALLYHLLDHAVGEYALPIIRDIGIEHPV